MSRRGWLDGLSRPRPESHDPLVFQALNVTRGTVLATRLLVADTPKSRGKGLLGRDSLSTGEGLWIVPCQAIHMFFMRFSIDLVYLDRKKRVCKVRRSVGPWRISACLTAYSVLELPSGTVSESSTQRGDRLEIAAAPAMVPAPEAEKSSSR